MDAQQRWIDETVCGSYEVQLGGAEGLALGWGKCLAVDIPQNMALHRSHLGSNLASKSLALGLQGMAAVAYTEVSACAPGFDILRHLDHCLSHI